MQLVQLSVNTTGLPAGWTTLGQITATATYEGEAISGSPKTAPVMVFIGDIHRVFLPGILKGQ